MTAVVGVALLAPASVAAEPRTHPSAAAAGDPAVDAAVVLHGTRTLATELRRELRDVGRAGLLAGRAAQVEASMPYDGAVAVRVRLGYSVQGRVVDRSLVGATAEGTTEVRIHLTRKSRVRLAASRTPYLSIEVTYRPEGGTAVSVTRRAALGPAGS